MACIGNLECSNGFNDLVTGVHLVSLRFRCWKLLVEMGLPHAWSFNRNVL